MHEHYWDFAGRGPLGRGSPFGRHSRHADFSEFFGGPPPRADRGVVRYLVLDVIAAQPRHGYEIIQTIEERSGGTYKPSPGVVYPTLQMLEELGHARVEEKEARKVYAITDEGRQDLTQHADDVKDFYEEAGIGSWEDVAVELRDLSQRVARMFKSIGRSARRGRLTPTTMKRLRAVLDEAVQKIEAIIDPADRR